jgi:hypothetical protein
LIARDTYDYCIAVAFAGVRRLERFDFDSGRRAALKGVSGALLLSEVQGDYRGGASA